MSPWLPASHDLGEDFVLVSVGGCDLIFSSVRRKMVDCVGSLGFLYSICSYDPENLR